MGGLLGYWNKLQPFYIPLNSLNWFYFSLKSSAILVFVAISKLFNTITTIFLSETVFNSWLIQTRHYFSKPVYIGVILVLWFRNFSLVQSISFLIGLQFKLHHIFTYHQLKLFHFLVYLLFILLEFQNYLQLKLLHLLTNLKFKIHLLFLQFKLYHLLTYLKLILLYILTCL